MQKKSLFKGLLTTAFAAAMAVMVAVPAKAAPAAPALSLKNTITDDQHVTGYTFSTQQVSNGSCIYFNVYKTDPKVSETGEYTTGTINSRFSYAVKKVTSYYDESLNRYYYPGDDDDWYYYDEDYDRCYVSAPTGQPAGYSYGYGSEQLATPVTYEYFTGNCSQSSGSEYTLNISGFAPGTYQVTATLYDGAGYKAAMEAYNVAAETYGAANDATKQSLQQSGAIAYSPNQNEYYSAASAPITITVTGGVSIDTAVTSTSVQLDLTGIGKASGYDIYRKAGKKFVKIATTSKATYTDKGLTSKTKYTYKVRPYYYDTVTKAKTMGAYTQVSVTTNGSALNLKAQVKGKKKVVLSWTKVKGATKYEVYRSAVSSSATMNKKGQTNAYSGDELVATVKKSKKKYVDKKAVVGEDYVYTVRAVVANSDKKNSKKKLDVEDAKNVSLKFGSIDTVSLGDEIVIR